MYTYIDHALTVTGKKSRRRQIKGKSRATIETNNCKRKIYLLPFLVVKGGGKLCNTNFAVQQGVLALSNIG
jgi:hypothetical protein